MQAKSVMYAAVGAPVVAARKVSDRVGSLKGRLDKEAAGYTKRAETTINLWAAEGEKLVNKVSEGKVVEEISSKVDLDQAREQVTKLRDQLEDMLATWRTSFRPEGAATKVTASAARATAPVAKKPAAKKPAAKKPAAKKPAAKKPAAKTSAAKTTQSSSAAKTSSAKPTTARAAKAS